jgi:hypothetical protein
MLFFFVASLNPVPDDAKSHIVMNQTSKVLFLRTSGLCPSPNKIQRNISGITTNKTFPEVARYLSQGKK